MKNCFSPSRLKEKLGPGNEARGHCETIVLLHAPIFNMGIKLLAEDQFNACMHKKINCMAAGAHHVMTINTITNNYHYILLSIFFLLIQGRVKTRQMKHYLCIIFFII